MKSRILVFFSMIMQVVLCNAQNFTKQFADIEVGKHILDSIKGEYCLYSCNDTVSDVLRICTWKDTLERYEVYAYFIDEKPMANWEHACRYVFVSKETGEIEVVHSDAPPMEDMWTLQTPMETRHPKAMFDFSRARIQQFPADYSAENNYAVILSGGGNKNSNWERYWNDCSAMYKTLVNAYGYRPDHIYVIMSDGTDPAEDMRFISGGYGSSPLDLDGNGTSDIQYAATKSNISYVFSELGGKLTEEDNLFVFVTDHGSISGSAVSIVLWNGVLLSPAEFSAELNKVDVGAVNIMMAQCFSGGFIPALEGQGRVISTACSASEQSFSAPNHVYDEFPYHWISAVCGFTPDGNPVDADVNDDGFVSMMEAFQYARTHDVYVSGQGEYQETPQYSSQPSNFGDRLTLRGIEVCTTTRLSNQTISSIREVEDCSIEVNNVSVKTGGRLILHYDESVLLNAGFSMEVGAELIIED